MYGKMYGMVKTTVYLPDRLKASLERLADATGESEAALIRRAIESLDQAASPVRPTLPLFSSGDATLSERVDEALEDFGSR